MTNFRPILFAYDRIEWNFLKVMMVQLNFSYKWINLIMDYVTSVSYSVLINGTQSGFFRPGRGELQGINMGDNTGTFSHLMFAGDTLLLGRASLAEAITFMNILKQYEIWSSPNISDYLKVAITSILGMLEVTTHEKYLGLSTSLGTSKKDFYSSLITRVKAKVKGSKPRLLSKVRKEIFIKSVLQAIPNYHMQCFLLPIHVCNKINSILSNYWWGSSEQKKSIYWTGWSKLCNTKANRGLGFRDLRLFNMALLSKQAWRIITDPHSQLARIYKPKYFPQGTFWNAQ
ncbi:hypothetical protein LIER_27187 [Lithospermum erythrorhizon]|uniref:Reverse transcriptase n=1 Tax=Lithospermum erythrorhizon TaxID=34254 RepID=A0AAV3RH06_LITER